MFMASFLNQDHYRTFNIPLARKLGSIHCAILLCELISQRDFFASQGKLTNHETYGSGWFFYTIDKVEERTCLSRKMQDHEINLLVTLELIESRCFGLPARRHFKINDNKIIEYLGYLDTHNKQLVQFVPNGQTSLSQTDKLECAKGTNYIVPKGQTSLYIEEPKKETNILVDNADAFRLAHLLFSSIKKFKKDFKEPKLEQWAKDLDRMIRIDKRDIHEIEKIIDWLPSNEFWRKNILSASKLREQFDKLQLEKIEKSKDAYIKTNRNWFLLEQKENLEDLKHLFIKGEYLINKENQKELHLGMNPDAFKNNFLHIAGVTLYE